MEKNLPQPIILDDNKLQEKFKRAKKRGAHIEDFFTEFLGTFVAEKTRKSYLKDLKLFFDFLRRGKEQINHPKQICSYHLGLYRDWMMEKKYAPATITRRMVSIRSFIKWAMGAKLVDYNPLDGIKLPKTQTLSPTQAFDDEEVRKMIARPKVERFMGNTHRLVLILLFNLGLRRGEMIQIKMRDIIRERHHIALLIRGKGDKKRLVPLTKEVLREIDAYSKRFATHTGKILTPQDFLIQTRPQQKNSTPCDGSTIYRIVNRYARELGINKRVSPHSCRATVISHLLDTQGSSIRDVADFAGHCQTTTTERYDKKRKGLDQSAAYQVDYKARS